MSDQYGVNANIHDYAPEPSDPFIEDGRKTWVRASKKAAPDGPAVDSLVEVLDENHRAYTNAKGNRVIMERRPNVRDERHAWKVVEVQAPKPGEFAALISDAEAVAAAKAAKIAELFEGNRPIYAEDQHAKRYNALVDSTLAELDQRIAKVTAIAEQTKAQIEELDLFDPLVQGLASPADQSRAANIAGFIREDTQTLDDTALFRKLQSALAVKDAVALTLYKRYLSSKQIAGLNAIHQVDPTKPDVVAMMNVTINPNAGKMEELKKRHIDAELAVMAIKRVKFEADPGPDGAKAWRKREQRGAQS